MRALLLFCTMLLISCGSVPTAPDLAVGSVVTVQTPVGTPCIKEADIPVLAPAKPIARDADPEQFAAWLKLRIDEDIKPYIAKLRAALIACSSGGK